METMHLLVEQSGSVLWLTLNRPERLNAFSPEMIAGLTRAIERAAMDDAVRAIVLSGAGRAFSAGGDVKAMGQSSASQAYEHIGRLNRLIMTMKSCEKPIIAAVHGVAAGAGFNLALACDLILAAEDSQFILSFANVGLVSDGGGSYWLPRLVGPHLAKQFFFTAEPISAHRLYELGVLSKIVPAEELREAVEALAAKLAARPTKAIGKQKRLIEHALTATLEEILEEERLIQGLMVETDDHREGVAAFKEKRKPVFQGK
ncbi:MULTISPECIES: enoyl-CoA hydratase/isomerase family protein [Geobacillus]|jgi:2-(1,2-epoxy-1,2-dihydrophenyl)acetyl-CoA isomerase|uniref:Enoyl CoA hydratase n=2 Tax=Geobacillus thermodenitrificans TaxID=33940 RepID=A4INJ5_GEOTN|nr:MULTISPECIES: enoyl-CoA hydratase-related protein [Geobacillus]PZN12719.1 MAG: enoyl-CoA hydratase [Pseudomonadota bacterium]ABO66899.1 Enoyl CoA hydratase [Geobacillus thermodenitrificans NG80-2]ATO36030.1 enoyl-CoA hydratase [Geobacillus thermodenitrificans]KQB93465.1 enoyl-CoA hydratase [Geobacillus sp. PA-3]MED0661704.1 enoyl-CoA hydratase [Geobacillus thermodenitrificans]